MELNREFLVPVKGITTPENLGMLHIIHRTVVKKFIPVLKEPFPEIWRITISLIGIYKQPIRFQCRKNSPEKISFVLQSEMMDGECRRRTH